MEAKPPKAQLIEDIVELRKKRKTISPDTVEKIVTLRKQGNTLEFIASEVKSNAKYIIAVLRRELEGEYDTYRVLGTITNESAHTLIGLRKKGKFYSEMSHKTKLSFQSIDSFFSESSRLMFDKSVARLQININQQVSSEIFVLYQKVWERVRLWFKKAEQLLPIVVYMFTKIKGIDIDIKELKESSGLT